MKKHQVHLDVHVSITYFEHANLLALSRHHVIIKHLILFNSFIELHIKGWHTIT